MSRPEAKEAASRAGKKTQQVYQNEGNHPLSRPEVVERSRDRMTKNNPMKRPEVRAKVSSTLRAMGHGPVVRKGNGTGLTECEQLLAARTGFRPHSVGVPGWLRAELEVAPKSYKIDLACVDARLAVEVDGLSHKAWSRREQDKRKDFILSCLGWTVVRVTNEEVRADPDGVAKRLLSMTLR
jgi:hypothetical protein